MNNPSFPYEYILLKMKFNKILNNKINKINQGSSLKYFKVKSYIVVIIPKTTLLLQIAISGTYWFVDLWKMIPEITHYFYRLYKYCT